MMSQRERDQRNREFDAEFPEGVSIICDAACGPKDFQVHVPNGGPERVANAVYVLLRQWSEVTVRGGHPTMPHDRPINLVEFELDPDNMPTAEEIDAAFDENERRMDL